MAHKQSPNGGQMPLVDINIKTAPCVPGAAKR